ncbi:hypothetical protein [Roseibium sp.]|uniref:hypothetical protein n=1 Tax=Roseibium sp. TaxID=1936156 RepID=UPI003A969245
MGKFFAGRWQGAAKSRLAKGPTDFVTELKLAEAQERLRRNLSDILQLHQKTLPEAETPTEFAAFATIATMELIVTRSGFPPNRMSLEQRFVVGLFAFLVAHELGRRTLADLGVVFAVSALELFEKEKIADVYRLGSSYGRLQQEKRMYRFLVETIREWFNDPTEAGLEDLVELFRLCCRPN